MVAESMLIFSPILQLGCFNATSFVIFPNFILLTVLKGPPDPVNINLLILFEFFLPAAMLKVKNNKSFNHVSNGEFNSLGDNTNKWIYEFFEGYYSESLEIQASNVFFVQGFKDACAQIGASCQMLTLSGDGDQQEQLQNLESSIAQGVDGIITTITHPTIFDAAIDEAIAKGIPVISSS